MFANPQWFHDSSRGLFPRPSNTKGYAFYAICLMGIVGPALILILRNQIFPEAVIWLVFSVGAFLLENRGLTRDLREQAARKNMFYIDDSVKETVETDDYELRIQ